MQKPEIAKPNRAIAQFMRGEIVPDTWTWHYHEDWNQLIPVIEKIKEIVFKESLQFDKKIGPVYSGIKESLIDLDIFSLWCRATIFIHLYNKKKKHIKKKKS